MMSDKPTAIEVYREYRDKAPIILDALKLAAVVGHKQVIQTEPHPKYGVLHQVAFDGLLEVRWLTTNEAIEVLYPEDDDADNKTCLACGDLADAREELANARAKIEWLKKTTVTTAYHDKIVSMARNDGIKLCDECGRKVCDKYRVEGYACSNDTPPMCHGHAPKLPKQEARIP